MSREFVNIPVPVERVDDVYELLARKPSPAATEPDEKDEDARIVEAYRRTTDTTRQFLDILADHPGELIGAGEMERQLGRTSSQFRGHLGAFARLWSRTLKGGEHWFFNAWGSGEGGTMEYRATVEVAEKIRRAQAEYSSKKR